MFGRNLSNRVRMKKVIVGDSVQLQRAVTQVVLATENFFIEIWNLICHSILYRVTTINEIW